LFDNRETSGEMFISNLLHLIFKPSDDYSKVKEDAQKSPWTTTTLVRTKSGKTASTREDRTVEEIKIKQTKIKHLYLSKY
jgi:hypothetical protein